MSALLAEQNGPLRTASSTSEAADNFTTHRLLGCIYPAADGTFDGLVVTRLEHAGSGEASGQSCTRTLPEWSRRTGSPARLECRAPCLRRSFRRQILSGTCLIVAGEDWPRVLPAVLNSSLQRQTGLFRLRYAITHSGRRCSPNTQAYTDRSAAATWGHVYFRLTNSRPRRPIADRSAADMRVA